MLLLTTGLTITANELRCRSVPQALTTTAIVFMSVALVGLAIGLVPCIRGSALTMPIRSPARSVASRSIASVLFVLTMIAPSAGHRRSICFTSTSSAHPDSARPHGRLLHGRARMSLATWLRHARRRRGARSHGSGPRTDLGCRLSVLGCRCSAQCSTSSSSGSTTATIRHEDDADGDERDGNGEDRHARRTHELERRQHWIGQSAREACALSLAMVVKPGRSRRPPPAMRAKLHRSAGGRSPPRQSRGCRRRPRRDRR